MGPFNRHFAGCCPGCSVDISVGIVSKGTDMPEKQNSTEPADVAAEIGQHIAKARAAQLVELSEQATGLGFVADKITKHQRKTVGTFRDLTGAPSRQRLTGVAHAGRSGSSQRSHVALVRSR